MIKLKAWDKYFCKMCNVISINFSFGIVKLIPKNSKSIKDYYETTIDDIVFLQYIGINDKDNKEIYTGDLVVFYDDQDSVYEIIYKKEYAIYVAQYVKSLKENRKKTDKLIYKELFYEKEMKIVGNIYENI